MQTENSTPNPSVANLAPDGMQQYLDKALEVLQKFNIVVPEDEGNELASLLEEVVEVDEPRVMSIARTLKYISSFNELVRDNVENVNVGHRYAEITGLFDSIRDDSKKLVDQLDDGKIDLKEKILNLWMLMFRGSPHKRFEKIKDIYKEVSKDTKEQLTREDDIMDAYIDFRFALKDAEINSREVLETQKGHLETAKKAFEEAVENSKKSGDSESAEASKLQLARDEAERKLSDEDKKYQLLKDVAENLSISYSVGETLISKLKQTHDVKDQVHRKSITFFNTNEHVFTILDAVYTSQHGLHEATQTTEALQRGVNKGLEDVASLGRELEKQAIKAGYGSTISPKSVQKLVDAVVDYQLESKKLIEEMRKEADQSQKEISQIVEDGKKRHQEAILHYQTQ